MAWHGRGLIDITGNRYGRLTVLGLDHISDPEPEKGKGGRTFWLCRCDCGKEVVYRKDAFAYANSHCKSCGCYGIEERTRRMKQRNEDGLNPMLMDEHKGENHWMNGPKGRRYPTCPKCGCFLNKEGKCNHCQ